MFVTTGDLISELHVTAESAGVQANIGGTLAVPAGEPVTITIRFLHPDSNNHHGDNPSAARVDLRVGEMQGRASDPATGTHADNDVVARFTEADWMVDGDYREVSYRFDSLPSDHYIRVRGTNTTQLDPELDPRGEDPWSDLWFYTNPIRLHVAD